MFDMRAKSAAAAAVALVLTSLTPEPSSAAAADAPVWRITEVAVTVQAPGGGVSSGTARCPSGKSVVGGDIRDVSNVTRVFQKAAVPNAAEESFLGAAGVGDGGPTESFTVVAYCVASELVAGRSVAEVVHSVVSGSSGGGGGATCGSGARLIGGGARLEDISTNQTGYLRSGSPHPLGNGWYATARLDGTAVRVVALCMPASALPPISTQSRSAEAFNDVYSYYHGQGSAHCPDGQRVLAGGAYTAPANQFPHPADPDQGRIASASSMNGWWHTVIGMNPGYRSTTVLLCIPDADPPTVTMTSPAASPLAARTELTAAIDVAWRGTDGADFVQSYQTRWRSAPANGTFGAWQYPPSWSDLSSPSVTHGSRALGYTYCYSTRGQDPAGNWSAWAGQRCAVRPLDDRSLVASTGWTRGSAGTHWNGTFTRTTAQGATLSRSGARFNQLGLVATKCPTCGRVAVELGSTRLATIDLASATTLHRQVIALPRTAGRVGTVTIRVLSSGKEVTIDGLAVSAS